MNSQKKELSRDMVNRLVKQMLAPVLDPLGNWMFMPRLADLGLARRHGERTRKVVALTFDDGPVLGGTEAVLGTLGEFGILATFFCIGANTLMHPDVMRRAYDAGHIIGAHSMNHGRTGAVSPTDGTHIDSCMDAIRQVIGRTPALYRPPWGWLTPWESLRLRKRGLAIIKWDIETPDSEIPCPDGESMFAWTLPRVRPGSIVVFHDGMMHAQRHDKPETVRALRLLIEALHQRDYKLVTIPDLLGVPPYQDAVATQHSRDTGFTPAAAESRRSRAPDDR